MHLIIVLPQLVDELTQLANKWTKSVGGIYSEQGGFSRVNVGKLGMWTYRKIKSKVFIHNDDVKCFRVVVQDTQKMVVMGCINFED